MRVVVADDAVLLREGLVRLLTDEIPDPARAYLVWTAVHGIVSIELTHAQRSPLPGFFIDFPAEGERLLVDGVTALLRGLSA